MLPSQTRRPFAPKSKNDSSIDEVTLVLYATIRQHAATMHGDYLSGLRETSHISQFMKARRNNPRKIVSKNIGPSNDVLEELFNKPDLAFRKFLFVFDPLTCDSKSLGLMIVTFGKP
ncbi:hypothetical protein H5410_052053 [Solanum commersonii]|uniref:Uncharacterized protein n=1 Tax=Solanum commersonii TaxID=4109 RepID=A0A9J5X0B1_SOLCO|nr:hypothetical protein H5410_052053 [Solanum commersonii]